MTNKEENDEDRPKDPNSNNTDCKSNHPPQPVSSSSPSSSSRPSSRTAKQNCASFHITSSHIFFATFILASAIVPIYVFDSPDQFLEFVNAFFFPPILASDSNSNTKSSSSTKEDKNALSGWRLADPEVLKRYDSGLCSIEKISVKDLTPGIFESQIRFKKPVIVTFPNGAADWTDPSKWTRSGLVQEYSRWTVTSGTSLEIVRKGGNGDKRSSFRKFVDKIQRVSSSVNQTQSGEGHYVFDREFYYQSRLPKTLRLPKYFATSKLQDDSIFFLGASLSGVIFHKHSDTWNAVVYGRKRWFLYPSTHTPPGGVYPGFTVLEWLSKVYPNLSEADRPMECVQEPGEILYLPEGTYHATLNLGDTVAFAIQKKDPVLKTEILSYQFKELVNKLQADSPSSANTEIHTQILQILTELNRLLPESAEVMLKLGERLYELGQYEDSIPWLEAALRKDPFFVVAHIHLGKSFAKMREYEKAEAQFVKAAEISPDLWDVYKEYGEFLLRQGRDADALPVFKKDTMDTFVRVSQSYIKGTELLPEAIPFWFFYKQCQMKVGDMEGAEASGRVIEELKARQGGQ